MVEVARTARQRGHQIHFLCYHPRYRQLIESEGFPCIHGEPVMTDREAAHIIALDQGRGVQHPFTANLVRQRVRGELAVLNDIGADAVVIGSNPTTFLSARAAGVPLVYVRPFAFSNTHLAGGYESVTPALPAVLSLIAQRVTYKPKAFTKVAREYELELPSRTLQAASADLTLLTALLPMVEGVTPAPGEVHVGPIFYQPATDLPSRLLARSSHRPLIYVGMGSSGSPQVLQNVLRQLSGTPVDVLIAGSVPLDGGTRKALGSNMWWEPFVPAHLLHGHIDASLIHGGEGTVQAACLSGVPFAGIAMQSEERWNLEGFARYGNALRFSRKDIRAHNIADIVTRLLTDGAMQDRARRIREHMLRIDGSLNAVKEIERLLAS